MSGILKLIRYQNLFIIALTMYLMRWCIIYPFLRDFNYTLQFSELNFLFLVLAVVFIAAAGYIINDYFDRNIDSQNCPDKVVVDRSVERRTAILLHSVFNVIGVALGFYVSWRLGYLNFGMIFLLVSGALWFYSASYKRYFIVGNILIAILTAMVPFMVVVYEIPLLSKLITPLQPPAEHTMVTVIFFYIVGFSAFAFLITLIREIIKDMEDLEGDSSGNKRTIPVVLGITYAKTIVIILIFITILALLSACFIFGVDHYLTFWYFLITIILPLVYLFIKVRKALRKEDFHHLSNVTKLIMITGVLYSVVNMIIMTYLVN
jgi:4-hydroxybenzoate polyprenyltransferase